METMAEQFLATANLAYHANQDVNPFRGRLEALVESRCADDRYYIFADPARMPCFELAHLASAPGPQMSMREGWNTLGAEWRCVLDVAAAATEWRGAWANLSTLEE